MPEQLEKALDVFRLETIRRIDFLIQDGEVRKVAVAWEGMPTRWKAPAWAAKSDGGNEDWDRLWKGCQPDFVALGRRAGLETVKAAMAFEVLRANRLVFPDGTLDSAAARLLDALAAERLRAAAKKR